MQTVKLINGLESSTYRLLDFKQAKNGGMIRQVI